ncbi:uncharacterized protein LOC128206327 [Mya arenaria]|uniref:uncharacterized protein LOC128206327 n=1 Tax=Mya arenaria TaxID=6604 RepID=UPI0022E72F6D|nr:uncharacterized protein LOC128206327 [Mya arenaria]XP_052764666.1 uncharacterized protein LOC128206327 [Mya arenaria]XP_052764668.1 uncharacterized protein LOC128206327 [Mya arenaria]XP_052764669.1 uncharacterized protein LOC128206327 [Mya arenaria]
MADDECASTLLNADNIEKLVQTYTTTFVKETMNDFHAHFISKLGRECNQCTTEEILHSTCPNNVCHEIRDAIQKHHRTRSPAWNNTNAEWWCTYYWQVVKCFLPENIHFANVKSAEETSLFGLLHIIYNCTQFNINQKELNDIWQLLSSISEEEDPKLFSMSKYEIDEYIDCLQSFLETITPVEKHDIIANQILVVKEHPTFFERTTHFTIIEAIQIISDLKEGFSTYFTEVPSRQFRRSVSSGEPFVKETTADALEKIHLKLKTSEKSSLKQIELKGNEISQTLYQTLQKAEGERKAAHHRLTIDYQSLSAEQGCLRERLEMCESKFSDLSLAKVTDKRRKFVLDSHILPSHPAVADWTRKICVAGISRRELKPPDIRRTCSESNLSNLQRLLQKETVDICKISNKQRLNASLYEEDLCSMRKETQEICQRIKSLGPNILDVYAAYKYPKCEPPSVAFIVTVKNNNVNLKHLSQYNIVKRTVHCYSNEGRDVLYSECNKQYRVKAKDEQRLKASIERNETLLMQRHRYLNMVSGSAVRSKGYKDKHLIEPTVCLVLYVHAKGYVPIDETPFRNNYDDIPVDVREGGCWRLSNPINIGEFIQRDGVDKVGSIGGFFELPSVGLCGITSAHVLLNDQEFMQCKQERRFTATGSQQEFRIHSSGNEDIGRLISAMYEEGNDRETGFEVAIFHIERPFPFEGVGTSFQGRNLEGDSQHTVEYSFESGQILENRHFYPDYKCCKYGMSSGFTIGELISASDGVGCLSIQEMTFDKLPPIVLRKQYEVKAFSEDETFATFGDSGALVFCWRDSRELVCIGMIVACTSQHTTVVSPIAPFLKQLGISKMKIFKKVKNERLIETLCTEVKTLNEKVNQIHLGINALLQRNPHQNAASENRTSEQTDNDDSGMVVE